MRCEDVMMRCGVRELREYVNDGPLKVRMLAGMDVEKMLVKMYGNEGSDGGRP